MENQTHALGLTPDPGSALRGHMSMSPPSGSSLLRVTRDPKCEGQRSLYGLSQLQPRTPRTLPCKCLPRAPGTHPPEGQSSPCMVGAGVGGVGGTGLLSRALAPLPLRCASHTIGLYEAAQRFIGRLVGAARSSPTRASNGWAGGYRWGGGLRGAQGKSMLWVGLALLLVLSGAREGVLSASGLAGSRTAGSGHARRAGVPWPQGHAEGCTYELAQQGMPRSQACGWLALVYTLQQGFKGAGSLRGLSGETPVASGAGHHLGYKKDLVSLLHIALELQQG